MYLYFFKRGSDIISRTSIPSVRNWRRHACLITKMNVAQCKVNFLDLEYLDPCRVRIRAVIKSDGVAHLMPQQGTPLLCYTVGYLSASVERHAESKAILFQTMSRGMTLL